MKPIQRTKQENYPAAARSRDSTVFDATERSMHAGPSANYRYSDNKLGDTRALIGESVCQTCQTEGDVQCHSRDR